MNLINRTNLKRFIKYITVGIINTFVGGGVIILMIYFGFGVNISNIFGYTVGLIVSYILNRKYVFKSSNEKKREIVLFVFVFILALSCTILVVNMFMSIGMGIYISQFFGMSFYTVLSYILNKAYSFKEY